MKENVKYQDSRVALGHGRLAVARCLGCFCLLFLALPQFAFSAAIVVRGNLNLGGNLVTVDSFDSTDPAKSTNGQYDPTKAGDNGDVYAGLMNASSVSLGNAQIYGTLFTGPTNYGIFGPTTTVSLGPTSAIGTHSWQTNGGIGIEPGFALNTNVVLQDVTVPTGLQFIAPASGQVITQDGPATNQTFAAQTNLPALDTNQSFTSITTNFSTVTTTNYPGPVPGLTTNITSITTNSYPGDMPDLETNCVSFVTVTNDDPGPQQCLTITSVDTFTTADYPGPVYGLVTNTIITPPCITATTNGGCSDPITSSTLPDSWCAANGITTNCGAATTNTTYPAPGTFCPGTVITNHIKGVGGPIVGYTYDSFGGYTYTTNTETVTYSTNYGCQSSTNYTYTYPATNYFTYANQLSYTYPVLTYSYPQVSSYDYTIYSAWTYDTNYYDNILSGGDYFTSNVLVGATIVTGPSTLVVASNFISGGTIWIEPGGSLSVYVESGTCQILSLEIINETGAASNLLFLCSPTVTNLTMSPGNLTAVVDAPEANATIATGITRVDFAGTLIANSLNVSGHLRMHCDESLGQWGYLLFPGEPHSPTLFSPYMWTNGQFSFFVEATPVDNCVVETSTDMINWNPVFTNSGLFEFTDTNGMNQSQCFYRTIYVQ